MPELTPSRSASVPVSICTTRIVAGVGVPQLTAIMDAVEAAKKANVPVIADGGINIRRSGQGARRRRRHRHGRFVARRHRRDPGEVFLWQGRSYKAYRGMGSVGRWRAVPLIVTSSRTSRTR